jgi:hypothetical protein
MTGARTTSLWTYLKVRFLLSVLVISCQYYAYYHVCSLNGQCVVVCCVDWKGSMWRAVVIVVLLFANDCCEFPHFCPSCI